MDYGLSGLDASAVQGAMSDFVGIGAVTFVILAIIAFRLLPQAADALKHLAGRR